MTLAALELPTETIKVGNRGDFTVRGLSFADVAALVNKHRDELDTVIGVFTSGEGTPDAMLVTLLAEMPDLAAKVIAFASDEPGQHEKVKRLPVTVQLDALMAVGRLTFEEAGGVKKFAEQVLVLLGASNQVIQDLLLSNSTPSAQGQ
jgi:hypothetical protein